MSPSDTSVSCEVQTLIAIRLRGGRTARFIICLLTNRDHGSSTAAPCAKTITMARSKRPLIGIALGSGVGRGWAHLGVLNVLEASGLKPDIICGTSIGALVGGACVGGRMAELEGWARGLTKGRMSRLFDFQLGASGVIAGRRVTQILHPHLQSLAIEELDRPFVAVATDLSTGHEVWLRGEIWSRRYAPPTQYLVFSLRCSMAGTG